MTKTAGRAARRASPWASLVDEVEGEARRGLGADVINITPEDLPTDFGLSGGTDFLLGTRIEFGKYLNPRTLRRAARQTARSPERRAPPGFRLEYRFRDGWRIETSVEPQPTLRNPTWRRQRSCRRSRCSGRSSSASGDSEARD